MNMRLIIIIALFFLAAETCYGQKNESYSALPESIVKREIAFFVKAASGMLIDSSLLLTEIKLSRCSNDFVIFESGNLIALDKLISIYSKPVNLNSITLTDKGKLWGISEDLPTTQISEVRFLHYKYQLLLADSAISGLYNPKFCINPKKNNKIGEATSTNCKAYQSKDKRRVYIYMLNGEGAEQYEVTWIINESNYYGRVIDKVML